MSVGRIFLVRTRTVGDGTSGNDDLVCQERVPISQVEHRLMSKLFRVVSARSTLEDDPVLGVDHVEITDPAICGAIHVPFDELGKFLRTFPGSKPKTHLFQKRATACQAPTLIGLTGRRHNRELLRQARGLGDGSNGESRGGLGPTRFLDAA